LPSVDHDARVWATAALTELYLLRLAYGDRLGSSADDSVATAKKYLREHLELAGSESFAVYSTLRQLERYAEWWSLPEWTELLAHHAIVRTGDWGGDRRSGEGAVQAAPELEDLAAKPGAAYGCRGRSLRLAGGSSPA
jgi:3',5'-cyclic AMP phosphodiesterase CpdA